MPTTASPQVRQPIPNGPQALGTCPTCGPADIQISSGEGWQNVTRTQDPGPDGRYEIHPHHDWCPVLTGETPEVACLDCGAPVMEYDHSPGVIVTVPHAGPNGMDGHLLGAMDEIQDKPFGTFGTTRKPAPDFDRVTVRPCGHDHRGPQAHQMLLAIRTARAAQANREAEALFAEHAAVTDGAEAAGHGEVVQRWRQAVRSGSREASGLLAAIKVLVGSV
jgi:hypothetical protein